MIPLLTTTTTTFLWCSFAGEVEIHLLCCVTCWRYLRLGWCLLTNSAILPEVISTTVNVVNPMNFKCSCAANPMNFVSPCWFSVHELQVFLCRFTPYELCCCAAAVYWSLWMESTNVKLSPASRIDWRTDGHNWPFLSRKSFTVSLYIFTHSHYILFD